MALIKNDVLKGKNDWLFLYQGGQWQFDYLVGTKVASNDSVQNFYNNIRTRADYCRTNKIVYKHVVFPSKPLLKTKNLPNEFEETVTSFFQRDYLNKFDQDIVASNALFYPLKDLTELEKTHSTFKKYDTHMTDRANYEIAGKLLNLIDVSIADHPCTTYEKLFGGDLANMLKIPNENIEEVICLENESFFQVGNRRFLTGNTNEVDIIHSFGAKSSYRLLIFGDSFFKDIIQYLAPFFTDIMYIRSSTMQYDIVSLFAPDVIFTGNAERYLSSVAPDKTSVPFLWSLYGNPSYKPSDSFKLAFSASLSFVAHHDFYLKWLDKCEKEITCSLSLDYFDLNQDIEAVNSSHYLKFNSIGIDPCIIYRNVDLCVGKKYRIYVTLVSSVSTTFQVFYTDNRVKPLSFNEEDSIREFIKVGTNHLQLDIDFPFLGGNLRIDPMNCVGSMEIIEMKLEEINSNVDNKKNG